jgi:uncharacterized damage-inducible protein DinB
MAKVKNPFGDSESAAGATFSTTISSDLERYAAAPKKIELALEKLTESKLKWKPNPKQWSIREIVCHLADSEMIGVSRLYLVISSSAATPPVLQGYDQDALTERLHTNTYDELQALQAFKYIRKHVSTLLKNLSPVDFEKFGNHTERGKMTLADLLKLYANHAETHLKQIERIKEELNAGEK